MRSVSTRPESSKSIYRVRSRKRSSHDPVSQGVPAGSGSRSHRILIPFAILILMRREGWVVSGGRIESFLIIVRIIHLFQGTEHTELDFQLIVEHILGSVQFSRIILHTAILDNTLLIDHAYRSTIVRIVVTAPKEMLWFCV